MSGRYRAGPWAGVDVGAAKGFDVAVIDERRLIAGPERLRSVQRVIAFLHESRPELIAVDAPCAAAPGGELSRPDERALVRAGVCGLRYTPNLAALRANPRYYGWVLNGLRLYEALEDEPCDWRVIECFPTATWTRLGGARGARPRARWSRGVLEGCGLVALDGRRLNQDARDAIGAAITARLHAAGRTERFGAIAVPLTGPPASRGSGSRPK